MPGWFLEALQTGGAAAAVIMTYMWIRAERRAEKYENLWVKANEELPDRIMEFSEQHRQTHEKLTKAVWASIRALPGRPKPRIDEEGV